MRCKCGGYIVISTNTKPPCGFCVVCSKWYEHDDMIIIEEQEKLVAEHKKLNDKDLEVFM